MYFVDMRKLNEVLDHFDKMLALSGKINNESQIDQLAFERIVQVMIESILDTGNMMIDGFIMRDPGSYLDIIHILIDEEVIPERDKTAYEKLISVRKDLVQGYRKVDHAILKHTLKSNEDVFSQFTTHIRTYLANEMGVANTFNQE